MDMAAKRLASIAGHILARSERECGPDVKRMMSSASTVCGIGPSPMDSAKLASHQATVPKLPLPALDQVGSGPLCQFLVVITGRICCFVMETADVSAPC
jgi:hypothetical protein